jgi:thioredoxin reductase
VYDVIIAGGGPAGLSAAEILGRCRRRVLVCDTGRPRNAASHALHGYLTRDGIHPAEFLNIARAEIAQYGLECLETEIQSAVCAGPGFEVTIAGGRTLRTRKLLIATGVLDRLPKLPGVENFYGRSVFHCPYCDGWEMRDQPLAVYGKGAQGYGLALSLKTWSADVVLCSDGGARLGATERQALAQHGIAVRQERIERLEGQNGTLEKIVFRGGAELPRRAIFFSTGQDQHSKLAQSLGCDFTSKGAVRTNRKEGTNVPGLYVAGDASRDVQFVIVAAAEGVKAAVAINKALQQEDREAILQPQGPQRPAQA